MSSLSCWWTRSASLRKRIRRRRKILDRINRNYRIKFNCCKYPVYPVNPVKKNQRLNKLEK